MCEWLNTVELLKSEFTNDIISPKKLKIIMEKLMQQLVKEDNFQ